ncbi:MAG TPA: hypothetical protein VHE30_17800 [Polyangiaceae bacterium]|nr:hypothetical protein [Polyangiaceae bacterium]
MLSRAQILSLSADPRRAPLRFHDDVRRDEGRLALVVALMAVALVLALLST